MPIIQLSKSSFFSNLDYFVRKVGKERICLALKDNAYGHGIREISSMAIEYGVRHCFVKNEAEALLALEYDFDTILILYPKHYSINDPRLIYTINTIEALHKIDLPINVEIKVDTGMCRNGIVTSEINRAIEHIENSPCCLFGVFTHFASADSNICFFLRQKAIFDDVVKYLKRRRGLESIRYHCCNTAGLELVGSQNEIWDVYRLGLGAYGYSPFSDEVDIELPLTPVMHVYAEKISSRVLNEESRIGYGKNGMKVAGGVTVSNYDIGYGDGFPRLPEDNEFCLADGEPILGCISMDSFSTYGKKSSVCLFRNASTIARYCSTITYEILTNFKSELPRSISE